MSGNGSRVGSRRGRRKFSVLERGHSAGDWVLVLGAEAQKRLRREERSFLYLKLTLAAAILGVIVGIIWIVVTAMHVD